MRMTSNGLFLIIDEAVAPSPLTLGSTAVMACDDHDLVL
jgi:hypothetical protein